MMNRIAYLTLIAMAFWGACAAKPMSESTSASTPTTTTASPVSVDSPGSNESEIPITHDNDVVGDVANSIDGKDLDYRSQYAAQMLLYMNHSVQPCDDFYEYACGNWKNVIKPRQSEHKRNNLLDIVYKLGEIAEAILQRPHINDVSPEYAEEFEMVKKFYNNCLQSEIHPMRRSSAYLEVIREIGGFPAVDTQWNASAFSWLNMSSHMSNYGLPNLIKEDIIPKYPFPPYYHVPDFGFDIELHYDNIRNSSSNAYKVNWERMNDILMLYEVPAERRETIIGDIFVFLKAVLHIIEEFDEDEYACSNLSDSLDESVAEEVYDQWLAYYDIVWKGSTDEEFMEEAERPCTYLYYKLNKICEEHKEAVANYLSMKFLFHIDSRLKDDKFQKDFCLLNMRQTMGFFFDHLYMKVFFNNDIRLDVQQMVKEIHQSLHTILLEADWLDESTRAAALLKESTMLEYVGRYEDVDMMKRLLAELKNLKFVEENYELNRLNMKKFKQSMTRFNGLHYKELGNTTKPLALLLGMQVNAFYYNIDNAVYVTAGILHPPVFHRSWPNAMKYGTLGFLVGHEFTHGFDTVGAHYDETGNNSYWWSHKSGKIFDDRSDCYVNHYGNYSIPEINRNVNGNMTKDENIADGGGLRMAFMAYRRFVKEFTKSSESSSTKFYKEEQMPGLDLTPEQLFFLSSAQMWCSSYKEAHYWEELSDEHTIDKYRVLGMISNNEDFAKTFNCPKDSKMNPSADKCEIW